MTAPFFIPPVSDLNTFLSLFVLSFSFPFAHLCCLLSTYSNCCRHFSIAFSLLTDFPVRFASFILILYLFFLSSYFLPLLLSYSLALFASILLLYFLSSILSHPYILPSMSPRLYFRPILLLFYCLLYCFLSCLCLAFVLLPFALLAVILFLCIPSLLTVYVASSCFLPALFFLPYFPTILSCTSPLYYKCYSVRAVLVLSSVFCICTFLLFFS